MKNEKTTRKDLIDNLIKNANWGEIFDEKNQDRIPKEATFIFEEYPTDHGPVDYALFKEGSLVAFVEAKRESIDPRNVLEQAKRYGKGVDSEDKFGPEKEYGVPFLYSTNGHQIFFIDLTQSKVIQREVACFHTPEALSEFLTRDEEECYKNLESWPIRDGLRPYQVEAVQNLEQDIIDGYRELLIAMATGSGKTRTIISFMYRMLKAGLAKRVLFLVDRRSLAAQAAMAMSAYEAEPGATLDQIYNVYTQAFKKKDIEGESDFKPNILNVKQLRDPTDQSFIFVTTIQAMKINLFGYEDDDFILDETSDLDKQLDIDIPIHAFDLVIADECHRGYTRKQESKWRKVLNHYDAIKVGLTATPIPSTKAFFGKISYNYPYDTAVREGYLCDYDAIRINSKIGNYGTKLEEGEEVKYINRDTGQIDYDEIEEEEQLDIENMYSDWVTEDTDRKVSQELVKWLLEFEQEKGHFPKTLIFATNDIQFTSHSDRLVDFLRFELNRGDDFVKKITGNPNVDSPLSLIRHFRNAPEPTIVVTVDMLSTGVDIPQIEAIVFARRIKSRVLFDQMMGRGTRLAPEIYKTHFTVFDATGVLHYFKNISAFEPESPASEYLKYEDLFTIILQTTGRRKEQAVKKFARRIKRWTQDISSEGRKDFKPYLAKMSEKSGLEIEDLEEFAVKLKLLCDKHLKVMREILEDEHFAYLCNNYKKRKRYFTSVIEQEDIVDSEYLFPVMGKEPLIPDDYIKEFERFVQENEANIVELEILLNQPEKLDLDILENLRKKLTSQPQNFTEKNLKKAYKKPLTNIIQIILHALKGAPLMDHKERVMMVMQGLRDEKDFDKEQLKWLNLIEKHLNSNLIIIVEDLSLPSFTQKGASWRKLNQIFDNELSKLLTEINKRMILW